MLTSDKSITTPSYWNAVYNGLRADANVDASNTVRPPNTFDRFEWVAQYAEGPKVLGVGSGHARVEAIIKAKNPKWTVIASDQTMAALRVTKYRPYEIINGYSIPFPDKKFDTLIVTQALEYFEFQDKFMMEAKRVANKLICTLPIGEMKLWSQLFIYEEESFCKWISQYGEIELRQTQGDLLLVKLKFAL